MIPRFSLRPEPGEVRCCLAAYNACEKQVYLQTDCQRTWVSTVRPVSARVRSRRRRSRERDAPTWLLN